MQKIRPHLWYDKEASEAADFYVSTFGGDSALTNLTTIHNTPSGSAEIVSFTIFGYEFMAISAGPLFKPNPSISFHVKCRTKEEVDAIWKKLSAGGTVLMELGGYEFSDRYGWVQDKYGVSWQVIRVDEKDGAARITPVMMFTGEICGRAREAVDFYTGVFHNAKAGFVLPYSAGEEPDQADSTKYADFSLEGEQFGAMDSARQHGFGFNEGISLQVRCENQAEIDYYWEKLSAVPESEQCGWLKDKYGLSWQIVPTEMDTMMSGGDQAQIDRVTHAFLQMKKFDIQKLREVASS